MSYYPNQPRDKPPARFSGGAPGSRTKGGNTRSRDGFSYDRRTEPAIRNALPVATPAYVIEQVCEIDKRINSVPEKILAIAELIQNARTPQIQRMLESAVAKASSGISKIAKMDPHAPTLSWQHYAERFLTTIKEALGRDLETCSANLQMTRKEANSISLTETTMRNNILNQGFEESVGEDGEISSSSKDSSPKKRAAEFESPFKQQSAQKSQELSEAHLAMQAIKDEIADVAEAIAFSNYSAEVEAKAKAAHAKNESKESAGPSSKREIAWDRFVIDLLTIITAKTSLLAALQSTVNDLCSRLRFVDIAHGRESDERIRRLAQTSRAFDWVQKELTKLKEADSSAIILPIIAQLRAAEAQCAEELGYVHIGSILSGGFVCGTDSTNFIDYLTTIESSKGLLNMQQHHSDHGQVYALSQQPCRQIRERSTTSRVQSTYESPAQDRESQSEESEEEAPPAKQTIKRKAKNDKGVFLTDDTSHQGSPTEVYPTADRCSRDNRSVCLSRYCEQRHARYNKQSTTVCKDDNTPGIWCERAFEISGAGCPHLHHQDIRSNPNNETRPPPYPSAGAGLSTTSHQAQHSRMSERRSTHQRDSRDNNYQPSSHSRRSSQLPACTFFFTKGGCKSGSVCRFSHEKINR